MDGAHGRKALWVFLVFLALVLALVHGAGWFHLTSFRGQLETELGQRLLSITRLVAADLPGDGLLATLSEAELASVRQQLLEVLRRNRLASLTILDGENCVIVTTSDLFAPGEKASAFAVDGAQILDAWSGRAAVSGTIRVADYFLKSAYAPIEANDGVVVAVLAAEGDHEFLSLITVFERQLLTAGLSFVILLVAGLGVRFMLGRLIAAQRAAMQADKLATVGRLAAGVTHEIRNPLSTISTTAQLLQEKAAVGQGPEGEQSSRLFGYILEEVDRLNGIVERFLAFARQQPPEPVPCRVSDLVAKVEGLVHKSFEHRGVDLTISTAEPDLSIRVDPGRFHQAVLNCLLNAADAVSEGDGPSKRVWLRSSSVARDGTSGIEVTIEDDGPGFPKALGDRVLAPFVTDKNQGTGLGLAVAKEIMEEHGGTIRLGRSEEGGAQVVLVFPLSREV